MKERYYSLDVFRGATVAFMIMVNNQAGTPYLPLDHAPWHGCTPTDLVFPFFLFAVGNAMAFVMPRFEQAGTSVFLQKVFKRTLLIFLIGLFLNWCPFVMYDADGHLVAKGWEWMSGGELKGVRVMGVLQRIALCYCFASLIIYFFKTKGAYVIAFTLLMVYWAMCAMLGSPADPYSLQGYFGNAIDNAAFGAHHLYHGEGVAFDPEGLAGTISAIVSVIFGYFVGQYIQLKGKNYEMLTNLFVAGLLLLFAGYWWDMLFPVNKKIWTSSYVVFTSGLAMLTLAAFIFIIEFKNSRGWVTKFFNVFGKNPLFIFFLGGFLPRVLDLIRIPQGTGADGKPDYTSPFGWFYLHVCRPLLADERAASLFYSICLIVMFWLIGYVMDKKKIYVRV